VNVSSVNGLRSFAGVLAYNISKSAVDQMTRTTALGMNFFCYILLLKMKGKNTFN